MEINSEKRAKKVHGSRREQQRTCLNDTPSMPNLCARVTMLMRTTSSLKIGMPLSVLLRVFSDDCHMVRIVFIELLCGQTTAGSVPVVLPPPTLASRVLAHGPCCRRNENPGANAWFEGLHKIWLCEVHPRSVWRCEACSQRCRFARHLCQEQRLSGCSWG
jgi:hypothetical protein